MARSADQEIERLSIVAALLGTAIIKSESRVQVEAHLKIILDEEQAKGANEEDLEIVHDALLVIDIAGTDSFELTE